MSYRLECASTGRAGCKATDCKREGVKIDKGALRLGVWVEAGEFQSWAWRHWGCVTTTQIANIRKAIDGDVALLDGYETLSDLDQQRISKAFEEGHIADADCFSVDPEMNRPGAKEAVKEAEKRAKAEAKEAAKAAKAAEKERQKAAKEAEKEAAKAEKAAAKEAAKLKKEAEKVGKEATKGKKRTKKESESDEEDANNADVPEKAAPPKKRAKGTRVKGEQEPDTDGLAGQVKPEDLGAYDDIPVAKGPKKSRAAKVKQEQEADTNGEERDSDTTTAVKASKKGRTAKVKDEVAPAAGTRRSARNRK